MELILASPYQYIRRGAGEEYLFDLTYSLSALVDLSERSASARTLNGLNAHLNQLGTLQLSNLPSSRAPCPTKWVGNGIPVRRNGTFSCRKAGELHCRGETLQGAWKTGSWSNYLLRATLIRLVSDH